MNLEELQNLDFDALEYDQRVKVEEIIKELKLRKQRYPILDFTPQPFQQEFVEAVAARNEDWTPKYKFIILIGWNGTGKTLLFSYITQLKAMGKMCEQYNLPYIWDASIVKVVTSTGSQVQENIEPYMLWTGTEDDIIKFPWYLNSKSTWEIVKRIRKDKDILKNVELINWTSLFYGSYDQWQARLQGWSPDLTWIDEVPTRWEDFRELIRWTRKKNAQFIMSFTPTNYNQQIHDWVFGGQKNKFVRRVDAFENKFADHSWMEGLSEDELRIVRFWEFTPPTWLVFKNFRRNATKDNPWSVCEHIHPNKMGTKVKYYWALDFWVNHPMAFLFIAVDEDGHTYVFDEIYEKGLLLSDLVSEVKSKLDEYWIELEYVVADSAGWRERLELQNMGLRTKKAKKKTKENNMSNVRGGILKVNQMLWLGKLIISDKCENVIREFQTYHYKGQWADGTVNKEWDDAMDALRYFIFSYTEYSEIKELKKTYKKRSRRANRGK